MGKIVGKPVEKIRQTVVRIEPEVLDRLSLFCTSHPLRPRRDSVIEVAIIEYIERQNEALEQARQQRESVLQSPSQT